MVNLLLSIYGLFGTGILLIFWWNDVYFSNRWDWQTWLYLICAILAFICFYRLFSIIIAYGDREYRDKPDYDITGKKLEG
jgi:amino acid permease